MLVYYQARVHVSIGERDAAIELLRSLKGRQLGLIPVRDIGFDAVWDDPEFQAVRDDLAADEPQTEAAPVAFRLPDAKLIPEGIAYDAAGARFFIGSIAQRKIIVTDGQGEVVRDFSDPADKLDAVLGLAVDAPRGHLYAISTNGFLADAEKERRNAVVRYDLKSGRLLDRFTAPDALQLNDLAIAPDGTVYVTDSMGGSVWRKAPESSAFTTLGAAGALRGANGIALGTYGLYVAVSTGIMKIDPASGEATKVAQPDHVATGGIDGLYWHDGALIGVQNSTNPGRVIRLSPKEKGSRTAGMTVLQSHHHPDFEEPTTGVIANGALHVIGNSYVGRYAPDGTIRDADELKGTAIIAVPLAGGSRRE